jgi:beta-glucosidase
MTPKSATGDQVLADGFKFGVANAAFQVEGGLNGPGEPANNWVMWERAGRVEPSGSGVGFWDRYEEHLDRAAAIGGTVFRLSIEWARVEPEPGQIDTEALDRYDAILRTCIERKMEPFITLHHFTHPSWLGDDFWLSARSPEIYQGWVGLVVDRLGKHCNNWITVNEINILSLGTYLLGMFPPGRWFAFGDFDSATAHLLAAHVKGYEAIRSRLPSALISTNNSATSIYEYDRLFIDLLLAPASGVARHDLEEWIGDKRRAWYRAIDPPTPVERLLRKTAASKAPIARVPFGSGPTASRTRRRGEAGRGVDPGSALAPALDAIYGSPHSLTLDALAIDYYDPVGANHFRLPGHTTAGGRSMSPAGDIWDEQINPVGMHTYLRANLDQSSEAASRTGRQLDVWIIENGMCNRVRRGRSFDRIDGWDRPRYLRENLASMVDAIDGGIPISAYLHWSLVDNYEWGSYEPRFGLYGVDRERNLRILDTDAMGSDAAGTYKRLIAGLQQGDRSVLEGP